MDHQFNVMGLAGGASPPGEGRGVAGRPRPHRRLPPRVAVAGAHGGAGTTTLAVLLGDAWDLGAVGPGGVGRLPAGLPLVLAVRCTAVSAGRAVDAVRMLAGQGVPVAVLAVTGDGLPEPSEASYRFRVLEGRVGGIVRVPFIPALRCACDPRQVRLPRAARGALGEIRFLSALPDGPETADP